MFKTVNDTLTRTLQIITLIVASPLRLVVALHRHTVTAYWNTRQTITRLIPPPSDEAIGVKIEPYLDLMGRIGETELWDGVDGDTLSDMAHRESLIFWWAQLHRERGQIARQRAALAVALYHVPEDEWPFTAAEYAVASATLMLSILLVERVEQREREQDSLFTRYQAVRS